MSYTDENTLSSEVPVFVMYERFPEALIDENALIHVPINQKKPN